tara:strand:+ start:660 stop:794 length:135 start_codon:yes stop_codon:yes gene_type:complete
MTTAFTPNSNTHGNLTLLDSRFVDVASLKWEKTDFPGIEVKHSF